MQDIHSSLLRSMGPVGEVLRRMHQSRMSVQVLFLTYCWLIESPCLCGLVG